MAELDELKLVEQDFANLESLLERKKLQLRLKRAFDFSVSLLGMILLLPLLLLLALIIKLDSRGPILFKQERVGKNGKLFRIYKFRTMIPDAESKGMQITVGADRRITKVGHYLRKLKLDEFPQLLNVLLGDMSFVGPRPEVPKYVALYNASQRNILKVKPGITDVASVTYRNENELLAESQDPEQDYINKIMPHKLALNLQYLQTLSIAYDLKVIWMTIRLLIKDH